MTDSINLIFDEDGVAREYDDTYDVVIHCESKEEQDKVIEYLNEHAPTTAPTTDHTTDDPNDCISRQQEIIRCGDCKYFMETYCSNPNGLVTAGETDYCSKAKRRDR